MRLFHIFFMCALIFGCSKRSNPVFSEMHDTRMKFLSDTIYNVLVLHPDSKISIRKKSTLIEGREYFKTKLCLHYVVYLRADGKNIYMHSAANQQYGIKEQLLFDFSSKGCWDSNFFLDRAKICFVRNYSHALEMVTVFKVTWYNNVTDFPAIEEFHVGPAIGIVKIVYTDGSWIPK